MKFLRALGGLFMVGLLAGACSSGETYQPASEEAVPGTVSEAITAACSFDTIGLPCDPDGPANPTRLECEGVCSIGSNGLVACVAVAAGILDGVVCGNANGAGNAACTRHCSGRTCLNAPAGTGAACRPNSKSSPCDGQCDGAGHCDAIDTPCDFGRDQQLCTFATCTLTNATNCLIKNLPQNVLCSDADACAIGKCSKSGVCVAGPTVGCDDGNACTDDECDPNSGACIGTNDDANTCSDGNACTDGDSCASGVCVPGKKATDCNDNNACTTDSCDPNTGCAHVAKSCDDGNACTDDSCDPNNGQCSHTNKVCNDSNLCTIDDCNTQTGCTFTPLNCDDADACTEDSCFGGSCVNTRLSCNDGNDCTDDSCQAANGCINTLLDTPECQPTGDGGAGGAPTDGGAPPTGGAPTDGGAPDQGGESAGGAPSTAGTGGSSAGTDVGGTAGTDVGGTAGTTTAGSTTGGSSVAGKSTGGSDIVPEGGESTAGGFASGNPESSGSSSGCGCSVPGERSQRSSLAVLALLGVALLRRRR